MSQLAKTTGNLPFYGLGFDCSACEEIAGSSREIRPVGQSYGTGYACMLPVVAGYELMTVLGRETRGR